MSGSSFQRLSPLWSITALALCGGAVVAPQITWGERGLAAAGVLALAWYAPARRTWTVAALALGLVGALRQHAVLWNAAPWEGASKIARVDQGEQRWGVFRAKR